MGLYNIENERFYPKYLADLRDSQLPSGELAPIVPTSGWGLTDNPNSAWDVVEGAVPAWDAALFVMPWEIYRYTGDPEIVRENYGAMERYLGYLGSIADGHIVDSGLGDWLPPGGEPSEGPSISSTAWYYRLTDILENCAAVVKDHAQQERCRALKVEIREAFNERFLNPAGDAYECGHETEYRQTSAIQPLAFGLVPEKYKAAVFARLKSALCSESTPGEPRSRRERATCSPVAPQLRPINPGPSADTPAAGTPRLNTGILGTHYLLDVLADNGETDLAYEIVTSEEYPSWGYWFANDRISLGEAWELTSRSWSHHMFGSIDAWFYQYLAGIRPTAPGFKEISIVPHIPAKLDTATATVGTPEGDVRSSWTREEDGSCRFELEIPEGVKATFSLPAGVAGIRLGDELAKTGICLPSGRTSISLTPEGEIEAA